MSKTIASTIAAFAGEVVIPSRLTMPQVMAWEAATNEQAEFIQKLTEEKRERFTFSEIDRIFTPILCELVEEWHIEGVPDKPTPDTFPGSPRLASHQLIEWIGGEIRKVYIGEIDIPNA